MRIWHAIWNPVGHLVLWGEQGITTPYDLSLRQPKALSIDEAGVAVHPFACNLQLLQADLSAFEIEGAKPISSRLLLPTDNVSPLPLPSPTLATAEREQSPSDAPNKNSRSQPSWTFTPWNVPALCFTPAQAVSLLTASFSVAPQSLHFGQSFLFWREVSKLILEILCRGHFLPGTKRSGAQLSAWWLLLPHEENRQSPTLSRVHALSRALPGVCQALDDPAVRTATALHLVNSFLAHGADGMIRLFLSRHNLLANLEHSQLPSKFNTSLSWLNALTAEDSVVRGAEHELQSLEQRLSHWSAKLLPPSPTIDIRTTFRLQEPGDEHGPWTLEFLLQAPEAPEKLITAAELWHGQVQKLLSTAEARNAISSQLLVAAEEKFLGDLGVATRYFQPLRRALSGQHPTFLQLSLQEAYVFLREASRTLAELSFGIILPSWWEDKRHSVGLMLKARPQEESFSGATLSSDQLIKCSWAISLGGRQIDAASFEAIAANNSPLIKVDGQWIELSPERIGATRAFLAANKGENTLSLLAALRLGLGIDTDRELLPIVEFNATGWLQHLLEFSLKSFNPDRLLERAEPESFFGTLRPYQKEGVAWLAFLSDLGIGACLADDMGLGKTIQLLALLAAGVEKAQGEGLPLPAPTLLVVPMSTLNNWEKESARFTPNLRTYFHHGAERLTGEAFLSRAASSDLVVTTYSLAWRDQGLFSQIIWGRVALDEAQNIKNVEAKQTKAIKAISRTRQSHFLTPGQSSAASPVHRLAMTGTPLENYLEEFWSIFDFLNPGLLGSAREFRRDFALPIEVYRSEEATKRLSQLVKPFMLRRLKRDPEIALELPEKIEMEIYTGLTEEQILLYRTALENILPQIDRATGIHRKGLVLGTITKLKQICDHPALFLHDTRSLANRSGKLMRMEELLEELLAEGDKVLIFTQFAEMGHLLKPHLQTRFDREVLFLHGGLSRAARDEVVEKFRKPDGPSIFVLSLRAGGFGLNLTEANQVIHYDQWWNPAVQEQASDRAFRIGQTRNVQVRTFITTGTLEERIHAMLHRKRELAAQIVGETKNVIAQFSTSELRRLLEFTGTRHSSEDEGLDE